VFAGNIRGAALTHIRGITVRIFADRLMFQVYRTKEGAIMGESQKLVGYVPVVVGILRIAGVGLQSSHMLWVSQVPGNLSPVAIFHPKGPCFMIIAVVRRA